MNNPKFDAQLNTDLNNAQDEFELEAALESWLYRSALERATIAARVARDRETESGENDALPKDN